MESNQMLYNITRHVHKQYFKQSTAVYFSKIPIEEKNCRKNKMVSNRNFKARLFELPPFFKALTSTIEGI